MSPPAPTPSELRILNCLWEHGPSTVREVHERVDQDHSLSYTTILKQMQIMHGKGLVERDDSQRAHVFRAVGDRDETQRMMLDDFMHRVYEGSASRLVLQALGISKPASASELDEIDRLIQKLRREPGDSSERGE
ncbi:MAG: BlaI/MecI/CopY family transcriptional regulator [Gammaproteobacteria bacterium]|jgi:predicted transcriptional regulator|nr:BlaI/MecI/CopY family transcriptional regulator [Gammaproteobacteria bacterium]